MSKQDKIAHTIIKLDAGNRLQHFVFLLTKTPRPQMPSMYSALVTLGFLGFFLWLGFPISPFFSVAGSLVFVWEGVFGGFSK